MNKRARNRPGAVRKPGKGADIHRVQGPGEKKKPGTITEILPITNMVAQLARRADVVDAADDALPDGPSKPETDETVFDEVAEGYQEGSDPDGDPSEQVEEAGDPFFDGDGGSVRGGGHRRQADAEIRVWAGAGQHHVAVLIPTMADLLGRFSGTTQASRYAISQFESRLELLSSLCEHFSDCVKSWDGFLQADSLDVAGRFFPNFTQENVAKALKKKDEEENAGVISRCRDAFSVDLPKFGVVSMGDLFDAAKDERLFRCAEVVRREHESDPSKKQADLVRTMIKECNLNVTERQGNTVFRELIERGLITWEQ